MVHIICFKFMNMTLNREAELLEEVEALKKENKELKAKIHDDTRNSDILSLEEYRRYGRQMQVPEFGGLSSQIKLKKSSILVIGAGGLGSPALLYLAAAGIGKIGIVDNDTVDRTNLHRQIIHDTATLNLNKAESAKIKIRLLNPNVEVVTHPQALTNLNSFQIIELYDINLDCTDTPASRYLINDTCVLLGKTIISGSGLKTEGQLTILNFHNQGPCYRCFYPTPPPPHTVTSCSNGGVVGPCIGILGTMMAVEALKCIVGFYTDDNFHPFLTLYSGFAPGQRLRTFKMRSRMPKCKLCNPDTREITREKIEQGVIDYKGWCGTMNYNVLNPQTQRITAEQLSSVDFSDSEHLNPLLDVRPRIQYDISHIDGSVNIPYDELSSLKNELKGFDPHKKTYVICRFGNDSQLSTKLLLKRNFNDVQDVIGGLDSWKKNVDPDFPSYW